MQTYRPVRSTGTPSFSSRISSTFPVSPSTTSNGCERIVLTISSVREKDFVSLFISSPFPGFPEASMSYIPAVLLR